MRYCQVGCDLDGVLANGFTPPEVDFTAISGRFKEACQFNVGDAVFITPDKCYPKGINARVIEVDGHPGDSGLLLCEWTNESGRLVTALHHPEALILIKKVEHVR